MATKAKVMNDGISVEVEKEKEVRKEPTVRVFLPLLDEAEYGDLKIDQAETVIINGKVTRIKRGEHVDVKVPVFLQLKQRYPNLDL